MVVNTTLPVMLHTDSLARARTRGQFCTEISGCRGVFGMYVAESVVSASYNKFKPP